MTQTVYRLTRAPYVDLSGEGARLGGGRWNRPGHPAVYTGESPGITLLELLVHLRPDRVPTDLVLLSVEIPDPVSREEWAEQALPSDWRDVGAESCLDAGDAWLNGQTAAVLRMPSAIIPEEHNLILNPRHPDHQRVRIATQRDFEIDARLLRTAAAPNAIS